MQKLVLILAAGSVFVGALMPDTQPSPSAPEPADRTIGVQAPAPHAKPETSFDVGSGTVTLERARDGHFYAEAQVNGMPVHFLIDTGATGIALSREDAQKAAIPMDPAMRQVVGKGASGDIEGQFVTLDRVSLGHKEVRGADAAVLEGGTQSLLGQSFLAEFGSLSIEGDKMVLR